MKKLFALFLIWVFIILSQKLIFSQDFEPTQYGFNFLGTPNTKLSADILYFQLN